MEKTVNEQFIKFSSQVPFGEVLELGDDLTVLVSKDGSPQVYTYNAVKSEDRDKQDGTVDRIFTLKNLLD